MKRMTRIFASMQGLPKSIILLGVATLALAAMFVFDLSIVDFVREIFGANGQSWPPPWIW